MPDLHIGDEVRDPDGYVGVVRNLGPAAWVVYPHTPGHGARAEWWPTSDLTPATTDGQERGRRTWRTPQPEEPGE